MEQFLSLKNNDKKINKTRRGRKNKLLIVEDEKHQRELYEMELQEEGYNVDIASNGKEALEKLKNNTYDLVILDIRMPEMNGIDALGRIFSRNKKIKIIIYTAFPYYKRNFLTWTADAYIIKSSHIDELKETVREITSNIPFDEQKKLC